MDVMGKTKFKGKDEADELRQPRADGFRISAEAVKSLDEVANALSTVKFLTVIPQGEFLAVLNVESRDIQKNPYLFSTLYIRKNEIEVMYTVVPGMSPKKRKIDVIRFFLNMVTLLQDAYEVDHLQVYQLIEETLKETSEYISSSYEEVYGKYDALLNETKLLNKKITDLRNTNDKIGKENVELKSKIDELTLRVKEAEAYSDEVLMSKIQQWLKEHRNEINVAEFSKITRVPETRIEQVLSRMVTEGFLEVRK